MDRISWLKDRILERERALLWIGVITFAVTFVAASLWKYGTFGYDGLDLAIFNQVFWNTSHGRPFAMSIHQHSYLGDHAGLAILPLSLVYALFRHPETLLVMQAVAAAAAAFPLFAIARHSVEGKKGAVRLIPLAVAFAWLLNPLVHHATLYEFHLLTVALPFLFLVMLAYVRERRAAFAAAAIGAMLFREDIALIVGSVGFLAMLDRRSAWWRYVPLAMGAAWFAATMALIDAFGPDGGYKFTAYYSWLGGDSAADAVFGALMHPLLVLRHVLDLGNLEMLIGFGLPLLFVPFLAPRRLVVMLAPLAVILLGAPGGSGVVLQTHYAALFLPALFFALIPGLRSILDHEKRRDRLRARHVMGIFLLAVAYSAAVMGPLSAVALRAAQGPDPETVAARRIIAEIPDDEAVAASYRLLPHLSSREHLSSLHYLYLGVSQFGTVDYAPDPAPRLLAVDERDFLHYEIQFANTAWAAPYAAGGMDRLSSLGGSPILRRGPFTIVDTQGVRLHSGAEPAPAPLDLRRAAAFHDAAAVPPQVIVTAWWDGTPADVSDAALRIDIRDPDGGTVAVREFPLVAPFLTEPSSTGEGFIREYRLSVFELPAGRHDIKMTAFLQDGALVLDRMSTTVIDRRSVEELGAWNTELMVR